MFDVLIFSRSSLIDKMRKISCFVQSFLYFFIEAIQLCLVVQKHLAYAHAEENVLRAHILLNVIASLNCTHQIL